MIAKSLPNKKAVVTLTAGENIPAGDCVFLGHDTAPNTYVNNLVPGRVYRVDPDVRNKHDDAVILGIALTNAASGEAIVIQTGGLSTFKGVESGQMLGLGVSIGGVSEFSPDRSSLEAPILVGVGNGLVEVTVPPWFVRGKDYIICGQTGSYTNNIESCTYSTESNVSVTTDPQTCGATSGSASGYRAYRKSGSAGSAVTAITFSTEISATFGAVTAGRNDHGSASSRTVSYTAGPSILTDAYAFSTDTCVVVGSLSSGRQYCSGCASAIRMYLVGGASNLVSALSFSTQVWSNMSTLGGSRQYTASCASRTRMYRFAGNVQASEAVNFSNDTYVSLGNALVTTTWNSSSPSSIKAYLNGGSISNRFDTLSFSSEVWTNLPNLLISRRETASGAS